MMTYLLDLVGHPKFPGDSPRWLKATTISALMDAVVKEYANLSQLAIRGNYSAVAAQGVAQIYSRNVAHHRLSVSNFGQTRFPSR